MAIDAARAAGTVLRARWTERGAGLETKTSATDVVLDADRAAESEVVRALRAGYPDDEILAEEGTGGGGGGGGRNIVGTSIRSTER